MRQAQGAPREHASPVSVHADSMLRLPSTGRIFIRRVLRPRETDAEKGGAAYFCELMPSMVRIIRSLSSSSNLLL
ncbi:hypothetical protein EYF80_014251 [Liparis tanakae]|uniref:Uncharacterized protein n=1 Tax=Liparis tanakae TaxID=230148 RepID=A0A4Z2IBM5_9TELE|nr:hypothetical protein EYF80_014251 [Liparis tanakae]